MDNVPVLEVDHLLTCFDTRDGEVAAVNDVSFAVRRGETLGIVGESGSGKSVTSLSVMGLIRPPAGRVAGGSILFHGQDLTRIGERPLRRIRGNRISMIFQDPMTSLNPLLTIGRQLCEGPMRHQGLGPGQARRHAISLLELVGIPRPAERLDDYPHQFSGGMRQRVMIAIALACDPDLVIADEPTTALDVTIQAQILDLLRSIQAERGTSIILITHDLGIVAGATDRVIVMYAGRVVEEAPTEMLFEHPRMPYTIGLLNSLPRLDDEEGRRLTPIPGMPPDLTRMPTGCPFAPRCEHAAPGRCDRELPRLRDVAPGHRIACHFDIERDTLPTRYGVTPEEFMP
ncbi:MAG: peptide ABC transporter ATP-binding protein [Rhodovulum sulfidophilum]|uniref:Peptide ABC transporter ATP-binding protein n=1 Tax=Rhodovulum sulfidophilum TaxID=35806 RepID=A0A2W5PTE2_RHOSU|nr:MAG: peptide ABC transporter ATP-binding protein [Rhodovulum sulfidophilum]